MLLKVSEATDKGWSPVLALSYFHIILKALIIDRFFKWISSQWQIPSCSLIDSNWKFTLSLSANTQTKERKWLKKVTKVLEESILNEGRRHLHWILIIYFNWCLIIFIFDPHLILLKRVFPYKLSVSIECWVFISLPFCPPCQHWSSEAHKKVQLSLMKVTT